MKTKKEVAIVHKGIVVAVKGAKASKVKSKVKKSYSKILEKINSVMPKTKEEKRAAEFISRLDVNRVKGTKRVYPPKVNRLKSSVKLMREIKLTVLHWISPITGHVIGYKRAHN